jgi:hypothetical protein
MTDEVSEILEEIYSNCSNKSPEYLKKYILTFSSHEVLYKLNEKNNYYCFRKAYIDDKSFIGRNFYVIIFPNEGLVIYLTKKQMNAISGLSLWVEHPESITNVAIQIPLRYENNKYAPCKSPKIIVTELPLDSLIVSRPNNIKDTNTTNNIYNINDTNDTNDTNNTPNIITLYDLLHEYEY